MKSLIHKLRIPHLRDELICTLLFAFLFNALPIQAQVITINQTYSSDTILTPFSGSTPVYSLKIAGGVNLISDSSLVRIVLIDIYGNHYLVYESYPLITHENAFDTINSSDETTFLDGVICDSLRIDIISAFLDLDSLTLDTGYIQNATVLQAQTKWEHDSVKIVIMNQRIEEENMYWRAGRTGLVEKYFSEKEMSFGAKFNILGFDYYKGGVYEMINNRVNTPDITDLVEEFDWRNRHGANNENSPYYDGDNNNVENRTGWITPIVDQYNCLSCWDF